MGWLRRPGASSGWSSCRSGRAFRHALLPHPMRLKLVRHLWGVARPWAEFMPLAKAAGYAGIEVNILELAPARRAELRERLADLGLFLVAQVFSDGFAAGGDVATHADSFRA